MFIFVEDEGSLSIEMLCVVIQGLQNQVARSKQNIALLLMMLGDKQQHITLSFCQRKGKETSQNAKIGCAKVTNSV